MRGLSIGNVGVQVTTGAASANAALPTDSAGNAPRAVLVTCTGTCYLKFGIGAGLTCTVNDILLTPNEAFEFLIRGQNRFAYLQETAAAKLNVLSIDNAP